MKRITKPKVGEKVLTWFSGEKDGMSTVLEVKPYEGLYKEYFTWTVKLSAKDTRRGWMESCV